MTRRSFEGATVVVSGAAGGLGRALADRFARAGSRVVLLDMDAEAVAAAGREMEHAGHSVLALPCDVTQPAACSSALTLALARFGRIDVVINNAGITHRSAFAATQTEVLRRVMEVNLFGAINLTRAALPALQSTRGLVVAVSSVAGYTPLIARTGYAASKHAVHGFFESLRTEVAPDGIGVMLVCPSFIATGIERHALGGDGEPSEHPQVTVGHSLAPDEVAGQVLAAAQRGRRRLLIGRTARAAWQLNRFAPRLYEFIMAPAARGTRIRRRYRRSGNCQGEKMKVHVKHTIKSDVGSVFKLCTEQKHQESIYSQLGGTEIKIKRRGPRPERQAQDLAQGSREPAGRDPQDRSQRE